MSTTTRWLRGCTFTAATPLPANLLKFMYEFWGYCVNGGTSLSAPGGLAATTPSSCVTNALEGTSVLASGTDGETTTGSSDFTSSSATFTSSMVGKHLVVWDPGSGSQEDSIYRILGLVDAHTVKLLPFSGGAPSMIAQQQVGLTTRTGLRFRVVDMNAGASVMSDGDYIVFQTDASSVNTGQADTQFQFFLRGSLGVGVVVSPGGTWSGSAFSDGTTEVDVSYFFNGGSSGSEGCITLVADPTFLFMHCQISGSSCGGVFHFEIPLRLYPQASDPNPFWFILDGNNSGIRSDTYQYGNGIWVQCYDGTMRKAGALTRALLGNGGAQDRFAGYSPLVIGGQFGDTSYAWLPSLSKVFISEALVGSLPTWPVGQMFEARMKMRSVRYVPGGWQSYRRFGDLGEWLHLVNGVCIPWDNGILPYNLMQLGF